MKSSYEAVEALAETIALLYTGYKTNSKKNV